MRYAALLVGMAVSVGVLGPVLDAPAVADDVNTCAYGAGDGKIVACTNTIKSYPWREHYLAWAYDNRGSAYYDKDEKELALADFDEAIRLDSNDGYAHNGLGNVYRDRGDKQHALAEYQIALRLSAVNDPLSQNIASKIAALQAAPVTQANTAQTSAPPARAASLPPYSFATNNDPHTAASEDQSHGPVSEIPVQNKGEITVIPVLINNAISLKFIIDSGATDVTIPADVFLTLVRTETIREADFIGKRTYQLADGSTVPSERFRIRVLRVGDREIENVTASVADVKASLLLGQSFLNRFKSWSIDNQRHLLLLN
jgi:hypothetical protein